MVGKSLSHYKIEAELGRGGMGIVYRATDTKLNRTVAVKVLPSAALATDDDRARFYREAQSAAQLHHPNIATIFEIDEAVPSDAPHGTQPSPFIAMEYVEGETLQEYIKKGPLKLTEVVQVAAQVADGLKAAHAKEIVHRDIKSANVMLTEDGTAKVLDFGLAKTNQSTMLTKMGSTLGTVAYMSPEQARGQEVDNRTDLYSLGTMMYEMIAGRVPFGGEYEQAVVYSILNESPEELTAVRTGVPMGLEWIVNKLMSKEPRHRYQTAADLIADLETVDLSGSGHSRRSMPAATGAIPQAESSAHAPSGIKSVSSTAWGIIGVVLLVGLAAGWMMFGGGESEPSEQATKKFVLQIPDATWVGRMASTHDGSRLVGTVQKTGEVGIHSIDLRTGESTLLTPGSVSYSRSISYDDEWFAYTVEGSLRKIRIRGGTPIEMFASEAGFGGFTWLPDGSMLVVEADSVSDKLLRIPAQGDTPILVASGAGDYPVLFLPVSLHNLEQVAITVSNKEYTDQRIAVVDLDSGEMSIMGAGTPVAYSLSGHLLFMEGLFNQSGVNLLARAFDAENATFLGPPTIIESGVNFNNYWYDEHGVYYSSSLVETGPAQIATMVLYNGDLSSAGFEVSINNTSAQPRLSPDGHRVMIRTDTDNGQILIEYNLQTGVSRQFSIPADGDADNAAYSPDGEVVFFESDNRLFRRNRNRSGEKEEFETPDGAGALDWSPTGDRVVFVGSNIGGYAELYLLEVESGKVTELEAGVGRHGWPRFSPDGQYISYGTRDPEGVSAWVMSLADGSLHLVAAPENTPTPNRHPMTAWTEEGKYLYYERESGVKRKLVTLDPFFEVLGSEEDILPGTVTQFDVSQDGTRIIAISLPGSADISPYFEIGVLTDLHSELRQNAPVVQD